MKCLVIISALLIIGALKTVVQGKTPRSRSFHLYRGGTYLKTVCNVEKSLNYDQSKDICEKAGTRLFVASNIEEQDLMIQEARSLYANREYVRWWVNGKKDSDGNWYTDDYSQKLTDLRWHSDPTGNCLSILRTAVGDTMGFHGWDCSGEAYPFCEFVKSYDYDNRCPM